MLRFSLRQLLGAMGGLCVAIALTQIEFVPSCVCLVGIIVVLNFVVRARTWRCIAYGAITGIAGGILVMLLYMLVDQGRMSASNYQESNALIDIVLACRSYLVHIGAYVGAIAALAVRNKRPVHPSGAVPSPNATRKSPRDQ